jgi:hypothetical protein
VPKSRPRCLILDAGPIIGLHDLGIWTVFCERCDVVVPRIVLDDEALFHSCDEMTGFSEKIALADDVAEGRIVVGSASLNELAVVAATFSAALELHDGELEALALLTLHEEFHEHVFCTADGAAIQGACLLGVAERCESLEELLAVVGLVKSLTWRYTREFMAKNKREGGERRITGFGTRG